MYASVIYMHLNREIRCTNMILTYMILSYMILTYMILTYMILAYMLLTYMILYKYNLSMKSIQGYIDRRDVYRPRT